MKGHKDDPEDDAKKFHLQDRIWNRHEAEKRTANKILGHPRVARMFSRFSDVDLIGNGQPQLSEQMSTEPVENANVSLCR